MSSSLPTLIILAIVLGLMAAGWLSTPKGPNQTLIRTSILLTLTCCYLMWAVTYLAQVHPLESKLVCSLHVRAVSRPSHACRSKAIVLYRGGVSVLGGYSGEGRSWSCLLMVR
ncbi:ATP synthase subunit H-domain-containing protein [Daedaleopsis nitida]|nr:ATP synthase subunit H-domain-containing protein [Daedaleopsis nitida]